MEHNGINHEPPRWAWITYQTLAWLGIVGYFVLWAIKAVKFYRNPQEFYLSFFGVLGFGMGLINLIACLGAVKRKSWAPHLIKVMCLWSFSLAWKTFINISGDLFLAPRMDEDVFYNYIFVATTFVNIFVNILFFAVAHTVSRCQNETQFTFSPKKDKPLSYVAILMFILGMGLINSDRYIEPQLYAETIGSYCMALSGNLFLVRHMMTKQHFLLQSAIGFSVLLIFYGPYEIIHFLTSAIWCPAILMGLATFKRSSYTLRTRMLAVGIPLILLLLVVSGQVSFHMTFGNYHKPSSQRPESFPDYLTVPDDATDVCYMDGDEPSLSYNIKELYPATETLAYLADRLERAGWRKLEYDVLNPEYPSSHQHGWSDHEYRESSESRIKHQWVADWINNQDEILHAFLSYGHPENKYYEKDMLQVHIDISQPVSWYGQHPEKYKQLHPKVDEGNSISD